MSSAVASPCLKDHCWLLQLDGRPPHEAQDEGISPFLSGEDFPRIVVCLPFQGIQLSGQSSKVVWLEVMILIHGFPITMAVPHMLG